MCDLCGKKKSVYGYELVDNTCIHICEDCKDALYGVDLSPGFKSRELHITCLLNYLDLLRIEMIN